MEQLLNTDENIDDIALAYFDEVDEMLKEITAESVYFALSPHTSQYKRLYLIGPLMYSNVITIQASTSSDFSVQLASFDAPPVYEDFDDKTDIVSCSFNSNIFLNATPIDILVTSQSVFDQTGTITFNISLSEGEAIV